MPQWAPRGPPPIQSQLQPNSAYDYPQRGAYPPQTTQYPQQSYGDGYPQQPPRNNWEQRPAGPIQTPGGYDYYGQGGPAMGMGTQPSNTASAPTPAPGNYNYGQPQAAGYGQSNPYSQSGPPQQSYGHGYNEPKYENQALTQQVYGHQQQSVSSQPGFYLQQGSTTPQSGYAQQAPYGKPAAYVGAPQSYGPARATQPGDPVYQGQVTSSYGSGQSYPYGSSAPSPQPGSAYGQNYGPASADGYNQPHPAGYSQPSSQVATGYGQGGQPVPAYTQPGVQSGGYGQYPPAQSAYGEQPVSNVNYGYQGGADAGYGNSAQSSAYGAAPAAGAQPGYNQAGGYVQPAANPATYDQSMAPHAGYGSLARSAPAGYAKGVSAQPGGYAGQLIHYLALHCLDVQQLTDELSSIGLLNLECATSHVLASTAACIQLLEKQSHNSNSTELNGWDASAREYVTNEKAKEFSVSAMRTRASMHATALLGRVRNKNDVHIMVTVGNEAIAKQMLLPDLLKAGANIIRINCAHEDSSIWSEIIRQARHNSQMLEKPCRILMDLAGPKLRTGLLNNGPNIMKLSPKKDAKGDVIVPAQVWLSMSGCGPPTHISPDAILYVESERFLSRLEVGNTIRFVDVRGRKRLLKVSKRYSIFSGYGYIAECMTSAYVESGTKLQIAKKKGKGSVSHVVNVPPAEQFVRLMVGDLLTICRDPSLSTSMAGTSSFGAPKITCDSGRLFDSVKPGEHIAFDDGKIWGVIQGVSNNEIVVSITHASLKGSKLGDGKSINIPDSATQFEGLTSKDLQDLEFVATNADMVGISFIRDTRDINIVMQELAKRKLENIGVVLKIETRDAFERLPLLLLEAMHYPNPLGVMIARGDLAVECGWDKMASIQEEILSVCRAAHIPVIWATQVLESLVKSGIPTRAEITDVASGRRANCIMLNKGKYIAQAVSSLDSILHDCSTKENMKTLLRPLLPSS